MESSVISFNNYNLHCHSKQELKLHDQHTTQSSKNVKKSLFPSKEIQRSFLLQHNNLKVSESDQ